MIINERILKKFIPSFKINNLEDFRLLVNNHIIEASSYYHILNDNDNLIKIGKIIEFIPIKENKNIYLVKIDIKTEIITIVCQNCDLQKNKKVIIALPGSYLFFNDKKTWIKKKKIDNIESNGILCSSLHLGLNLDYLTDNEKKNILFLSDDANIGECALEYLGFKGFFLDLSVTPDRNDLLSYVGFAKDLKSILKDNEIKIQTQSIFSIKENFDVNPFEIKISTSHCLEYHIRYIKNLRIENSPLWLRNKLLSHNIIPINNLMDVINLVLLEYGIPLIALDSSFLENNLIEIKNADLNERFFYHKDKKKYFSLDNEDIVIINNNKIISLAGIKTNFFYDISEKTQEIILCSFYFKPEFITKTSKKAGLKNESILRLSRGIDQNLIKEALDKATFLLQKIINCSVYKNVVTIQKNKYINPDIFLSLKFIHNKTGINFSFEQVCIFLKFLNYEIEVVTPEILKVKAPSNRFSVTIPEDVISDLIRIYGYNKISSLSQDTMFVTELIPIEGVKNILDINIQKLRHLLSSLGLNETINYSLVSQDMLYLFPNISESLSVLKPISYDKFFLRQNLSCSLLEILSFNQKKRNFDNAFFEIGHVYTSEKEIMHLSIILSGVFLKTGWLKQDILSSFFILKGILSRIESFFGIKLNLSQSSFCNSFLPKQQAEIFLCDKKIGFIGETHPFLNKKYHIQESFVMEISLENLLCKEKNQILFQEITKFPSIIRDFSFFVNKKYDFQQLYNTLESKISGFFIKCELLDFFQNDCVGSSEEYSLTFRLTFNDKTQNLNKEQVNCFIKQIELEMKKKYRIIIR
ncbi:phenylalanine--tRNA ligase subunit beta [Candidatus Phytoplasma oryzae]|nr:phenylalanine--tRNA ligase subunit beta [Candidatus Phytoplasma oryzae]